MKKKVYRERYYTEAKERKEAEKKKIHKKNRKEGR